MSTPEKFAASIFRRAERVLTNAPKATRRATMAVVQSLAENTPVDTTRARSNWVAKIGAPDLSPRGFRSISAVIGEARGNTSNLKADEDVHVANGGEKVPYLSLLNDGSSTQAPAGFVNGSIFDGVAALQNVRLLEG